MKTTIKYYCLLSVLFLYSCATNKHISDFRQVKKSIDTLVVLPALIDIKIVDIGNKINRDSFKDYETNTIISEKSKKILNKKYDVINSGEFLPLTEDDSYELYLFYQQIKKLDKKQSISEALVPTLFEKISSQTPQQYLIINYLTGFYPSSERVKYVNEKILEEGMMLSILSLGHVMVLPSIYNSMGGSFLITILYDKVNNKILYFATSDKNGDPRNKYALKKYVSMNLKGIYYK